MIFQDPMTSLDPMYTIGDQMIETIVHHEGVSEEEARERAIRLLEQVGIPKPEERIDDYPFQLSGGQRQRVVMLSRYPVIQKYLLPMSQQLLWMLPFRHRYSS